MRGPIALLKDAWGIFTTSPKLFLGIYLAPWIATVIYTLLVEQKEDQNTFAQSPEEALIMTAAVIVMILVNIFAGIAMMKAVADPTTSTVKSSFEVAKRYFLPYVVVAFLVGIVTMVGFILLIIPGIIFSVWFAFTYYIVLFEDKRGIEAMKASRELVRGHWWAVFGRFVALTLAAMLGAGIVGGILGAATAPISELAAALVTSAINFLLVPISVAYAYLMYKDLSDGPIVRVVEDVVDAVTPDQNPASGGNMNQ